MIRTLDELIAELQLLKDRGIKGDTELYIFMDDIGGYKSDLTVRVDGEGDVIIEG